MSDSIANNNNGTHETSAPANNHEPTHDRRAEVNRANAAHSTGPRNAAGKQRSSLNALRHGLTGHVIVLPSEDHAAYQHHTRRFFDDLQPKGALRSAKGAARTAEPVRTASRRAPFCASSLEEQLVQSIADTSWRLNRVAALETNLLTLGLTEQSANIDTAHPEVHAALAMAASIREQTRALANLSMHEHRLSRQFERTLHQLREIQADCREKKQDQMERASRILRLPPSAAPTTSAKVWGRMASCGRLSIGHNQRFSTLPPQPPATPALQFGFMTYWLGIDVGTGGTRALLVNEAGQVRHASTAPHEDIRMERPAWAEQRPENWWDAARQAVRSVLAEAKASGKEIRGVGLSGQMHGLVILDASNQVIRPALIWSDQRSQAQVDWINRTIGKEAVLRCTANPVLTGFTLPKLLWVRDNEPANFERIKKMLLPKDYIRFQLTGNFASDVSDASGTALFDVVQRRWSFDMVEAVKLDRGILPRVVESSDVTGCITAEAARDTGLEPATPVVGGGGDQAASAVGNGIVVTGVVSCTLGTSGVVFAHSDKPQYDPAGRVHTFCHAVKGAWHVMGVTQGAGLSLQWFRNQLAPGTDYDALTTEAATAPAGSQGLYWLPYLMGERTPLLDASARGGWIGITAKHNRADLIRSLLEGVSYSQKDCLDIIEQIGVSLDSVRASGGGARSPFWRQMLADVFNKRVVTLQTQEGSAYGAALLALVGTGVYASVPEVCKAAIREVDSVSPQPDAVRIYAAGHPVYQSLYPALKAFYHRIDS